MTPLDLTVFDLDRETHVAVARFYVRQVEAMMQEGVEEWQAREDVRHMVVALLLFTIESDEGHQGPHWEP